METIKNLMKAYQEIVEKKLSPAQKKHMDVDDDGDIDDKDLKKLRSKKTSGKKEADVDMEIRVEETEQIDELNTKQIKKDLDSGMSHDADIVDYQREKNSEVAKRYIEMLEANRDQHTKGATSPEEIDSKMSPKSKTFKAQHKGDVVHDGNVAAVSATAAGRATSKAPKRPADQ
jgi:hypothetical protein